MTTRHPLKTDGAWVELRDVEELTGRDRKAAMEAAGERLSVTEDGRPDLTRLGPLLSSAVNLGEAVAHLLIERWEVPYFAGGAQPGASREDIESLRLPDHERLLELIEPYVKVLRPEASNDPDGYADPASPSEPAST